jgi:uncharacterized coiled-coil protein SlyX
LEKWLEKSGAELTWMAKITELEVVTKLQADKITELEATCADLKCGKDKLTDGYQRLAEKHKSLEKNMANLVEANAAKLTKLRDDLHLERCSYTEYHQKVPASRDSSVSSFIL